MSEDRATRSFSAGALGAALFGSLVAVVLFSSTGQDDCHITFWAARSLADTGEILNHSGERVEQSSSLLHTLILALLTRATGVSIPWLAYLLGIFAAVGAVLRLGTLARVCGFELRRGSLLLLGTAPAFAYWQLGSLESTLFTWGCVEFLIGLARLHGAALEHEAEGRSLLAFVLWTGALVSSRPEAGILALAVGLCAWAVHLLRRRPGSGSEGGGRLEKAGPLLGVGIPLLWWSGLIALRLVYFDRPFPQPVVAKMGGASPFSLEKLAGGGTYLMDRFASLSGALLVMGVAVGLFHALRDARRGRSGAVAPACLVAGYLAFTVLSGGDWMKGWRFVAHVEPLMLFLLLLGLDRMRLKPRAWAAVATLLFALNVQGLFEVGGGWGTGRPIWTAWQVDPAVRAFANEEATWPERANQVHTRDVVMVDEMNEVVGRVLELEDRVRILSKQAGLVTYYAAIAHRGRIEFVDRLGLSSRHFERLQHELGLETEPMGLGWDLEDYFRAGVGRTESCFRPDVIFDLHRLSADLVERLGFVVVYEQAGLSHGRFAGARERAPIEDGQPASMDLLRVRPKRGRFEGKSPWSEETNMYQFIAVRVDLAERAGLVSVAEARSVLGAETPASAHSLYWDRARRPFLRDERGETREPPHAFTLPRVSRFRAELGEGELDAVRGGEAVRFESTAGRGPRRVSGVLRVDPSGTETALVRGQHYTVRGEGTPELELRLVPGTVPSLGRLRIEGLALGSAAASARAFVVPASR